MKVRIIQRKDGGISIVHPAPKSKREDETEEQWLDRVFAKATPKRAIFEDIDKSKVPLDRTFREAWTHNGRGIEIDMPKAKAIHVERWRLARKPLLDALDVEYMRALEDGNTVKMAELKAKKQALRDVTKIDLLVVTTPDELKKVWPEILNGLAKPV